MPIPVAARSKKWFCGHSLASCEFEFHRGHECLSNVSVLCCQVEVSATVWSPVQTNPTECGVSECDREIATKRRPRPTRGCQGTKKIVEYKAKALYISLSAACDSRLLYILAYQLLVTLGCFSGQKCVTRRKSSCRQMKTLTHVASFPLQWFFRSSTLFFAENLLLLGKYQPMDT